VEVSISAEGQMTAVYGDSSERSCSIKSGDFFTSSASTFQAITCITLLCTFYVLFQ
jgi:hypothetical protein